MKLQLELVTSKPIEAVEQIFLLNVKQMKITVTVTMHARKGKESKTNFVVCFALFLPFPLIFT